MLLIVAHYQPTQESWDYIGSSRMVYDIINHNFPHKVIMCAYQTCDL